jgi:SAM-dependent methyltransferase
VSDPHAALAQLAPAVAPREIDDEILDLSYDRPRPAHYDRIAWAYDYVLGSKIYNRLTWKTSPARCRSFARDVFDARSTGPHVELGCGSLLFTSPLYDEDRGRAVVLIDQSLEMLRRARTRLRERTGAVPRHVVLVRADARDMCLPPETGIATTVLAMHVLHVVEDGDAFLATLGSLARPVASTIGLTSIVRAGGRGDVFLRILNAAGELATPRTRPEVEHLVAKHVRGSAAVELDGSMSFVTVTREA